jgi:hypothetical protein
MARAPDVVRLEEGGIGPFGSDELRPSAVIHERGATRWVNRPWGEVKAGTSSGNVQLSVNDGWRVMRWDVLGK